MGLVTAKEVAKAINADKYGVFGTLTGWVLMKVLKISALNKLYDRNKHLKDVAFLGNDINDIDALKIVGHPFGVSDCFPELNDFIIYKTKRRGGEGAVRELCDIILSELKNT